MRALIELNFDNNSFSTIVWKILGNDRSKILTLNNNIVEFYNNSSIIDKFTVDINKTITDNKIKTVEFLVSSERFFYDTLIDKSIFINTSKKIIQEELHKHYDSLMKDFELTIRKIINFKNEKIIIYYFIPIIESEVLKIVKVNFRKLKCDIKYDFEVINNFIERYHCDNGYFIWVEDNKIIVTAFYQGLMTTFFKIKGNSNIALTEIASYLFELSEELASTDLKIFNVNNSETMVNDVIKILSRYNNHFSSCKIINVDKKYKRGLMYEIKQ